MTIYRHTIEYSHELGGYVVITKQIALFEPPDRLTVRASLEINSLSPEDYGRLRERLMGRIEHEYARNPEIRLNELSLMLSSEFGMAVILNDNSDDSLKIEE